MVPRASRAYVGKCQITRNDPRLCQVIDFCILRTFYSVDDSLFSLRLPGRRISTGSGLLDTVARTLKVAIRDENCRIRDENCRFLCSNSVILVYTLFTILKSRRELHISRLKRPLKKLQFSSSAFLVYTRITFLLKREIYLKQFSKKWRTRLECRKRIECRTRLECPPGRTDGQPDGPHNGSPNGRPDGRPDGWTAGRTAGRMTRWTAGRTDDPPNGRTDGRPDGWPDG